MMIVYNEFDSKKKKAILESACGESVQVEMWTGRSYGARAVHLSCTNYSIENRNQPKILSSSSFFEEIQSCSR